MVVFEMHNAKNHCLGSGVALQTPTLLYPIIQRRWFWTPLMVVFEMHSAKNHCLGFGVALQTPILLYPITQQRCFWIPIMVVFEMHSAKPIVWVLGWRYYCTPLASNFPLDTYHGGV